LRKVEVVRAEEVEVKPLDLKRFTMRYAESSQRVKTVSKKELKEIAESLGMAYDDARINFAKKLMNAYMKKEMK